MSWKPIIAGIDPSTEGLRAALVARELASLTDAEYRLVHVTHDVSNIPASFHLPVDISELRSRISEHARRIMEQALVAEVPDVDLEHLEMRLGTPAVGLVEAARDHESGLVVLGRKRHIAPTRWFGGSTVHHTIRRIEVPILLAQQTFLRGCRILVPIDLSYATGPTLEMARRFRDALHGELMILHVAEPLPVVPDVVTQLDEYAHYPAVVEEFERQIQATLDDGGELAEIRRGHASKVVRDVATQWSADLVVVGSHGKNWADRVMLGSTTERLINRLVTSILVVPVRAPKAAITTVMSRTTTKQST